MNCLNTDYCNEILIVFGTKLIHLVTRSLSLRTRHKDRDSSRHWNPFEESSLEFNRINFDFTVKGG